MVMYRVVAASVMLLSLIGCQTTSGVSYQSHSASTPSAVGFMSVGQQVVAPLGYLVFCRRSPSECVAPEAKPATRKLISSASLPVSSASLIVMSSTPIADELARDESGMMLRGPLIPRPRPDRAVMVMANIQSDAEENLRADGLFDQAFENARISSVPEPGFNDLVTGSNPDKPFELTARRWQELAGINTQVNDQVRSVRDDVLYQRNEWWAYPTNNAGDCEDYALMKRKLLMEKGWPVSNLLITVAKQWNGEGHAVLVAVTDRGEFVLDNMARDVAGWRNAPYQWVMRQSQNDPNIWVNLDPSRMTTPVARSAAITVASERENRS